MTPFLSMRHKKLLLWRRGCPERHSLTCWKEIDSAGTNLSPFHLSALNTDVKSGGTRPSCGKKVMAPAGKGKGKGTVSLQLSC